MRIAAVPLSVVLIEDHEALRAGLELLLDREGCVVLGTAGTAAAGGALVRALDPDVALIAVRLGDESGIALTAELVDGDPDRRVVLYTGDHDVELLASGLDAGARGYALKEGPPRELTDALETVVAGGTYVDPRLRAALRARRAGRRPRALSRREREVVPL